MNNKLLFFDVDGTLLSEKTHTIPPSAIKALKKAKEKGHYIIINTGRSKGCLPPEIQAVNPDGYIYACGTHIEFKNTLLLNHTLDQETIRRSIKQANKFDCDLVLEGPENIYFNPPLTTLAGEAVYNNYVVNNFNNLSTKEKEIAANKFCIWFNQAKDADTIIPLLPGFNHIRRSANFLEIVPLGYSKATGIQILSDYLKIPLADCYVFGDSFNDKPMLDYVDKAIVMGNGDPELFKRAYYVTTSCDNDGIFNALKHLKLI